MKTEGKKNEIKIENRYVKGGITLFCVGLALIAAYYIIHNTGRIGEGIQTINGILSPFYIGIIMAYLLCPIYNCAVRFSYRHLNSHLRKKLTAYRISRFIGTCIALSTLLLFIAGFFYLIIPDLIESIISIIGQIPAVADKLNDWFKENIQENPQLLNLLQGRLATVTGQIQSWLQGVFIPSVQTLISGVSVGIIGTLNGVLDVFIALIICVYILNSKELFQAQAKKIILAVCKPQRAASFFELGRICNQTFGGFINGNIIASILVGIICFIVMSIMNLPLATLISVIVGVTNVIPFFGPFIGAIPSAILLLIIDPLDALKFVIMIFVLQQVEGNIIAPKILGDTTGLPSFWVIFAIIVGGGFFGLAGMILGVPLFSVLYIYITRFIDGRLKKKGLREDTVAYEELKKYNINKEDIFGKDRYEQGREKPAAGEEAAAEYRDSGQ